MNKYRFTPKASKEFLKLGANLRIRIIAKLDFFCAMENPTEFAEHLTDSTLGEYRFRVGDYRIVFDIDEGDIRVVKVGHRREIYE